MRPDNLATHRATPRTSGHIRTQATSGPAYRRSDNLAAALVLVAVLVIVCWAIA